jgi:cytoskeleton protein RodZ
MTFIMTAEHDLPVNEENTSKLEAGTILKLKREELGLSQKQIADRLRLRVTIIENIENNQFASEQVATFTRGYLRSYAKAVGVEENIVLNALSGNDDAQHKEQEMTSFSRKTKREKHDSRIMTITWGIFAIIIGISAVWVWQNQLTGEIELATVSEQELELEAANQQPTLVLTTEPEVAEPTTAATVDMDTTSADISLETATAEDTAVEVAEVAETPVVVEQAPALEVATADVEPVTVPEVAKNVLEMTFNGDCWIQVKDATGKTISTGVKKTGQTLQLDGELPYSLILGAPENVSMTLSSEPVDLSGYTSGKVARFTLP